MKQYIFNESLEGQSAEIRLMSQEEFQKEEGHLPHRRTLLKNMSAVQYCKAEVFKDCILGTMKVPVKNSKDRVAWCFGFYLKDNCLYLIDSGKELKELIQKIKDSEPEQCTASQLLLYVFEYLLVEDVLYLLELEEQLEELEEILLEKIPERFYEYSISYRKELYRFHAYYEQLMNIGDSMEDYVSRKLEPDEAAAWKHYTDRTERLHNHTEMLREYLVQIRELYQTRIDMQQNKVMSFLTVVTTIFLPLTLIAGWYGMNFTNMPELGWKYGYLGVIAVSVVIMICEILYFTRKKKSWNPE